MIAAMIAALALQTGPAQAASQGGAPAAPAQHAAAAMPAAARGEPEKKTCRTKTVVGSNIEKRVCKTKAQWDAEAAAAAASMDRDKVERATAAGALQDSF